MPEIPDQQRLGGVAAGAATGVTSVQRPERPDASTFRINDDQRSLGPDSRSLNRIAGSAAAAAGAKVAAQAGAKIGELAATSPFFRDETPSQAAARLRKMLNVGKPPATFTEQVNGLRSKLGNKAERSQMRYGVAVVSTGRSPKLVGWGLDDMICIASMAKLAILYATFQLRADVEIILRANWAGDAASPRELVQKATQVVAQAFREAKDPNLRSIGRTPANMPVLERIFDLDGFIGPGSKRGSRPLAFKSQEASDGDIDKQPFYFRLTKVIKESGNNSATSCIADLGLPYIKALLTRSGLADVSGTNKGLWLGTTFGYWNNRSGWPDQRTGRFVKTRDEERRCEKQGSRKEQGSTGQGGTVRAIATFYELLRRGQLVDESASVQMNEFLDSSTSEFGWHYLISALEPEHTVQAHSSKIGILGPWFHDSAMIISTAPPRSGVGIPEIKTPPRTWIAVVLLSKGASPISRIAPELERAVQNYMLAIAE